MSGTDDPGQRPDEQVGSVSEEAAKLFGALSGWARDQAAEHAADPAADGASDGASDGAVDQGVGAGGLTDGLSGLAERAARAARQVDEHLATGSAECSWCPVCRTVHAVRQTSPEVRAHLATAASSLLQAAAGLLATAVPPEARADDRRSGVERIDLDTDDEHHQEAPGARSEEDER